jgi:hypothetical protein
MSVADIVDHALTCWRCALLLAVVVVGSMLLWGTS